MSKPQSNIFVCSGVRLTPDYRHTIWFNNADEQFSYFTRKTVRSFMGYTYLRRSWSIKVDAKFREAQEWSYLYFINAEFPAKAKTWYYFITNVEYLNDSTVELFLEMDVMQSYLFDHKVLECFVEREHSASDAIGSNLLDEGLELGEFMTLSSSEVDLNNWYIMILATGDPFVASQQDEFAPAYGKKFGNVFSGLGLYAFPASESKALGTVLNALDNKGHSDCIVAMWMYPQELFNKGSKSGSFMYAVDSAKTATANAARPSILYGGYKPRNNKLYCYPYNFLYVTNNNGGAAAYPYEFFADPAACTFRIVGALSPEGGVRMYPLNFKNIQLAYENGLSLGAYPTCAWNSDTYKLWLAQNQHQQNLGFAMAGLKIAGGVAALTGTGTLFGSMSAAAGVGLMTSGFGDIANTLAQRADKDIQPPQGKGDFSTTVNMAAGFQTFTIRRQSIDYAHAEMIDDFFDMYGYKTSRVKVPNRHVREGWTYTKTIGCTVSGNFCADDKAKLESIYNNGVTFWVDGDDIGNYNKIRNSCL